MTGFRVAVLVLLGVLVAAVVVVGVVLANSDRAARERERMAACNEIYGLSLSDEHIECLDRATE